MNAEMTLDELRRLSEAASPDWAVSELGITRFVRERGDGSQIGNFIFDEDAELAVAAVNYVRAILQEQPR